MGWKWWNDFPIKGASLQKKKKNKKLHFTCITKNVRRLPVKSRTDSHDAIANGLTCAKQIWWNFEKNNTHWKRRYYRIKQRRDHGRVLSVVVCDGARQQVRRGDAAVNAAVSPTCWGHKAGGHHSALGTRPNARE